MTTRRPNLAPPQPGPAGVPPMPFITRNDEPLAQHFDYAYMGFRCQSSLDCHGLKVKQGLRTFEVALSTLRHLYVQKMAGEQQALLLTHEPTPGKTKILRLYANTGEAGFQAFVQAIVAQRPEIDRRGLDEKSALKMMGAVNVELYGLWGALLFVPVLVAVALLPKAVHGLDFGRDTVSLSQLAEGKALASRNVNLTGAKANLDDALEVTTTHTRSGSSTQSTKYFVPLCAPDWSKTEPVHVVLETGELGAQEQRELAEAATFSGIVRNVLWEGLGGRERDYFSEKMGLKLADHVVLVEYQANPTFDLALFGGGVALTVVIVTSIGAVVCFKRRRR